MSSRARGWTEVGHADYAFIQNNVEAMTDSEIAQELGVGLLTVQRMRSDIGLRRNYGNGRHGKITSPGIEPVDKYEARMKVRLMDEGVTGDEARMFMRSFLLDRAREIEWCEFRMRLNGESKMLGKEYMRKLAHLKAECYFRLKRYER